MAQGLMAYVGDCWVLFVCLAHVLWKPLDLQLHWLAAGSLKGNIKRSIKGRIKGNH